MFTILKGQESKGHKAQTVVLKTEYTKCCLQGNSLSYQYTRCHSLVQLLFRILIWHYFISQEVLNGEVRLVNAVANFTTRITGEKRYLYSHKHLIRQDASLETSFRKLPSPSESIDVARDNGPQACNTSLRL